MMRLLERLQPTHGPHEQALSHSLCGHLAVLLASRPGQCRSRPSLGVAQPELMSPACEEMQRHLAVAICQCIREHEPRLQQIRVFPHTSLQPGELAFRIEAELATASLAPPARRQVFWLDSLQPLRIRT